MKVFFKVLGVLIILVVGLAFLFYGKANRGLADAEKVSNHGDYETTALLYEKGMTDLEKLPLSKIKFFQQDIEFASLLRAYAFYNDGYYNPEKYDDAEEIVRQELKKEKSAYKDQFYNLQALICWQKGVELFIKMSSKALYSKEVDRFLDGARKNSEQAVNFNDGHDWDIKYNWEFFHKDKQELKKLMQRQAKRKQKDREMKGKTKQLAGKKNIKPNEGKQKAKAQKENKKKTNEMKSRVLAPGMKPKKSEETENALQQKKKKKKKG